MTLHRSRAGQSPRLRHPKSFWKKVLRDFETSTLSPRDFCNQNNLALSTFSGWQRRLREVTEPKPSFIPVTVEAEIPKTSSPKESVPEFSPIRPSAESTSKDKKVAGSWHLSFEGHVSRHSTGFR